MNMRKNIEFEANKIYFIFEFSEFILDFIHVFGLESHTPVFQMVSRRKHLNETRSVFYYSRTWCASMLIIIMAC